MLLFGVCIFFCRNTYLKNFHRFKIRETCKNIFLLLLLTSFCCASFAQPGWENLFNGKDFTGLTKLNGQAEHSIRNGAIIGTSRAGIPNTLFATNKMYGDFILEPEYSVKEMGPT